MILPRLPEPAADRSIATATADAPIVDASIAHMVRARPRPAPLRCRLGVRRRTSAGGDVVLVLLMLVSVLLVAGCGGGNKRPPPVRDAVPAQAHLANAVLMRAIGLVGTPYRWGGNTPEGGFDCSGLVGFVFRDAVGILLPRSSAEIARVPARSLSRDQLAAGDLVLFGDRGRVDHIGIYVGERRFVHAPSSGGTVRLDPLDSRYWQDRFLGGRRLLQ